MSAGKSISQIGLVIGLGLVGYVAFTTLAPSVLNTAPDDNVATIATDNPEMIEAVALARETLPRILEMSQSPPAEWEPITLKIAMQGTDMVENIWIANVQSGGTDSFSGNLANDPVGLEGLKMGSRVIFGQDQITDWGIVIDGRGYGYYSVRAIASLMPEEEAAQITGFLSEDPLPPNY